MSKSNAIAVGGLIAIGVLAYVGYKAYQKGRAVGHTEGYQEATQKYEQQIQTINSIHASETHQLQTIIDQLKHENANLKENLKQKEK